MRTNPNKNDGSAINYSGRSMSMTECKQLCKEIVRSNSISEIRFCDCLLSEDLAKCVINAISFNSSIHVVDFKGNNFRSKTAEYLCKMMKQTTSIRELYLEWNALGLYDVGMSAIAEGLAANKSLQVLDLSNNQICHNGGRLLCLALKRNKTLRSLDMRWNNIGVAGGREFLSALQHNKTLINLQLAGNNIPSDTLKAIATSIQRNMDYNSMYQQHMSLTQSLKDELTNVRHEKTVEVSNLAVELEREKELHENYNHTTKHRLEDLNKSLSNLSKEKNDLLQENTDLEAELKAAQMKVNYLEESIADLSKCNSELRKSHEETLKELEESSCKERKQWNTEQTDKHNEINNLQKEVKVLQEKIDGQAMEISTLKNNVRLKEAEIVAIEQKHVREKELNQRENAEQVSILTDRNSRCIKEKSETEEELSRLKTTLTNEKLKWEEQLVSVRTQLKQEENSKSDRYEERIAQIMHAKDELHATLGKMQTHETDIQSKLVAYQKDVDSLKQTISQNQDASVQREQEHRKEVNKLLLDIDAQKRKGEDLCAKLDTAEKTIKDLHTDVEQQRNMRINDLATKEKEINSLRESVRMKEDEIRRNHQDELNRTAMLESAFQSYILSARASKH